MTNMVVLRGNLTRDVELKHLPDGKAVAEFGLAVNDGYGEKKSVSFFSISVFGRLAETVEKYTGKGSSVCISGKLKQSRWEKDGQSHSRVKVYANSVEFLGKKSDGEDQSEVPF